MNINSDFISENLENCDVLVKIRNFTQPLFQTNSNAENYVIRELDFSSLDELGNDNINLVFEGINLAGGHVREITFYLKKSTSGYYTLIKTWRNGREFKNDNLMIKYVKCDQPSSIGESENPNCYMGFRIIDKNEDASIESGSIVSGVTPIAYIITFDMWR